MRYTFSTSSLRQTGGFQKLEKSVCDTKELLMAAKKQSFTLFSICVILHVLLSKGDGGSRICAVGIKVLDS